MAIKDPRLTMEHCKKMRERLKVVEHKVKNEEELTEIDRRVLRNACTVGCCFPHALDSVRDEDEKGWTYDMLKDGGIKIRRSSSTGDYNLIFPKPIFKPNDDKEDTENA